ncbi:hypothetical protein [Maribacter aquivivus]|uniref:hypothetical protein n=1 Tax=Maribacter aquivivus TaxID=228958 RepID=UPI00248F5803|nr:hypothetical protein [Maribacter aquivivus]
MATVGSLFVDGCPLMVTLKKFIFSLEKMNFFSLWKLETGNWKLETGNWKLETGNWKLETP